MARLMQKIKDFLHIMAILYGSKVSKFRPRKNWNSEYAHKETSWHVIMK